MISRRSAMVLRPSSWVRRRRRRLILMLLGLLLGLLLILLLWRVGGRWRDVVVIRGLLLLRMLGVLLILRYSRWHRRMRMPHGRRWLRRHHWFRSKSDLIWRRRILEAPARGRISRWARLCRRDGCIAILSTRRRILYLRLRIRYWPRRRWSTCA